MGEVGLILLIIFGVIIFGFMAVLFWGIGCYNNLIRLKNLVSEGWSGIDVQLKRRSNLIPNLVATVEGFAKQEKEILTEVTQARSQLGSENVSDRAAEEKALGQSLMKLFAVAESYPDLKSDQNFLDLQNELSSIEDVIQKSRRYYNGTVRELNTSIEQFPGSIISGMFRFETAKFFEIENEEERAVPKVSF